MIWPLAVLLILLWPSGDRSLAVKGLSFLADPMGTLPAPPGPIPMGLGDDADAVSEHDEMEAEYYRVSQGPWVGRMRLRLRDLQDPMDPGTERQLLLGVAVLGALLVWRLEGRRSDESEKEGGQPRNQRGPRPS